MLLLEPLADSIRVVYTLLYRLSKETVQQRFDRSIHAVANLHAFATREGVAGDNASPIALYLVMCALHFVLDAAQRSKTLEEAGVEEGHIVFLTERAA